eukprot:SAG11_NODE_3011_length_2766_cov_2.386577_6_plen_125_part_00
MMGPWTIYERDGTGAVEFWRHADLPSAVHRYESIQDGFITICIGSTVDHKVEIMIHETDGRHEIGAKQNRHLWRTGLMIFMADEQAHHALVFSDFVARCLPALRTQQTEQQSPAAPAAAGGVEF